ncbi:hypothetical protein ACX80U_12175 [Arthrobacter sp. TmT3-37]
MTAQLEGQLELLLGHSEDPAGRHDLPPLWDGVPVAWKEWARIDTTIPLHVPTEDLACEQCGAVDEKDTTHGRRGPFVNLMAARCRHCGHDQVTDMLTGTLWDLDDTDYADIGSNGATP